MLRNKRRWNARNFHEASSPQFAAMLGFYRTRFHLQVHQAQVCDVGCGTGRAMQWFAQQYPGSTIIGMDNNQEMLAKAREILSGLENCHVVEADACNNPFRNEFDIVNTFFCIQWVDEPSAAIEGIFASLKEGGYTFMLIPTRHEELWGAIEETAADFKWQPYFENYENPRRFHSPEQYADMFDAAGFEMKAFHHKTVKSNFNPEALKRFIASWVPHLSEIPQERQDEFLADIMGRIDDKVSFSRRGEYQVPFRTLEVVAVKPQSLESENLPVAHRTRKRRLNIS